MIIEPIHILFIADVIGEAGFKILRVALNALRRERSFDLVIANGENAASGKGLTPRVVEAFFEEGIQVITSGNHIWNKSKIFPILNSHPYVLRPLNYPPGVVGHGSCLYETKKGPVAVLNLQGRSFMANIECPFRTADGEIARLSKETKVIIVDFHAEATAEKLALAHYLDGRVSALFGTHTHVQTADERILPKGTAYLTDVGMTGPNLSVIGMDIPSAIRRFLTQVPVDYAIGEGEPIFCAAYTQIDPLTGKALTIERIQIKGEQDGQAP